MVAAQTLVPLVVQVLVAYIQLVEEMVAEVLVVQEALVHFQQNVAVYDHTSVGDTAKKAAAEFCTNCARGSLNS